MKNNDGTTHFDPDFFQNLIAGGRGWGAGGGGWNKNVLGGKFLKN